jgi:hypothetical protein
MAKWLNDLYKEYMQEELEEDLTNIQHPTYHVSRITYHLYFGSLKSLNPDAPNKSLYFLVLRKVDDNLYEVLKVSDWHHFATDRDILINLGTMTVMIETDCNFYLTAEEISRFVLIDRISNEMIEKIKRFREGKDVDVKRGLTPISKYLGDYKDVREMFKEEEFKQIREYHMRVFELLSEE